MRKTATKKQKEKRIEKQQQRTRRKNQKEKKKNRKGETIPSILKRAWLKKKKS